MVVNGKYKSKYNLNRYTAKEIERKKLYKRKSTWVVTSLVLFSGLLSLGTINNAHADTIQPVAVQTQNTNITNDFISKDSTVNLDTKSSDVKADTNQLDQGINNTDNQQTTTESNKQEQTHVDNTDQNSNKSEDNTVNSDSAKVTTTSNPQGQVAKSDNATTKDTDNNVNNSVDTANRKVVQVDSSKNDSLSNSHKPAAELDKSDNIDSVKQSAYEAANDTKDNNDSSNNVSDKQVVAKDSDTSNKINAPETNPVVDNQKSNEKIDDVKINEVTNVTTDEDDADLSDKTATNNESVASNDAVFLPTTQQTNQADELMNDNANKLVLAADNNIQTGTWGTATFTYHEDTGVLDFDGNDETISSPTLLNDNIKTILPIFNNVKVININGKLKTDESADALFAGTFSSNGPSGITKYNWFNNLTAINGLNNLDTSNATSMTNMFANLSNIKNIDVSQFDTSKVTNMGFMFANDSVLTSLDVSHFDTSNVTSLMSTFEGDTSLENLDVSHWNTHNVSTMQKTFYGDSSLKELNVSDWDTSNNTSLMGTFNSCRSLKSLDVSKFSTGKVTNMFATFAGMNLSTFDVVNWDTHSVVNMGSTFAFCNNLINLDVSKWNTSSAEDMSSFLYQDPKLTYVDVSNWDTGKVKYITNMFDGDSSLNNIDPSKWDTSNVLNMSYVFSNCSSLTGLDLTNWDMSNVIVVNNPTSNTNGITSMFANDTNLSYLKVGDLFQWYGDQTPSTNGDGTISYRSSESLPFPAKGTKIPGSNHLATGNWQEIGTGDVNNPNGRILTPEDYAKFLNSTNMGGTWVWQPQKETINITYWDDTTNQSMNGELAAITNQITGLVGDKNSFDLQNEINQIVGYGFDYVSTDGNNPASFDSENPINITVHFTHHYEDVVDHDTGSITVHYYYDTVDGKQASEDKKVTIPFTRHGKKDMVNIPYATFSNLDEGDDTDGGKITWGEWTPDNGANTDVTINSPVIKGYTPTQMYLPNNNTDKPSSTDGSKVTWNVEVGLDCDADVVYTANQEQAQVQYVDDVTGKVIDGSPVTDLNGKYGENIDQSNVKSEIQDLEGKGYSYVEGLNDIPETFDFDGTVPMYTIHLTHVHSQVTDDSGKGQVTVHYEYDNGQPINGVNDVIKSAGFTRTGDKDNVTGEIKWNAWTPTDSIDVNVKSPVVTGYNSDKDNVTDTISINDDKTDIVKYSANVEKVQVQYVDDVTGKVIDGSPVTDLNGKYGENINQSDVKSEINNLEGKGYSYVNGLDTIPSTFDFDGTTPMYTIHLTHSHSDVTDTTGKGTETVNYVYTDGTKAADDKSETVTFHRTGDKDNVTGYITWGDWLSDSDVDVTIDSPVIDGYTADKSQVKTAIVEGQDNNDTVTYVANEEHVTAHYVDENGNEVASDETVNGKFGEDYTTTAKEIPGYHLVRVEGKASGKYTSNTSDVTYVYVKDVVPTVTPEIQQPTHTPEPPKTETPITESVPQAVQEVIQNMNIPQKKNESHKKYVLPQTGQARNKVTKDAGIVELLLAGIMSIIGLYRSRKRRRKND